jgi:uncharacterized membrane protein YeiH
MLKKLQLNEDVLYLSTSLVIFFVRLMAVKFKWYLPVLDRGKKLIGQIKKTSYLDIQHHLAL